MKTVINTELDLEFTATHEWDRISQKSTIRLWCKNPNAITWACAWEKIADIDEVEDDTEGDWDWVFTDGDLKEMADAEEVSG